MKALATVERVLRQARAAIDPNVPTQLVQAFVLVAMNEGKSLTELAKLAGSSASTASRHLLDLGERNRKKEPGYGLVNRQNDPMSLRTNIYTLTARGRLVATTLAEAANSELQ